jgi:hypothetical protein
MMHPSSSTAFQIDQECDLKHPGWVDLINKTKPLWHTLEEKFKFMIPFITDFAVISNII